MSKFRGRGSDLIGGPKCGASDFSENTGSQSKDSRRRPSPHFLLPSSPPTTFSTARLQQPPDRIKNQSLLIRYSLQRSPQIHNQNFQIPPISLLFYSNISFRNATVANVQRNGSQ